MDEVDWLTCADPPAALRFARDRMTDRKLRLFAVACCRRLLGVAAEADDQAALAAIERFTDGEVGAAELRAAAARAVCPSVAEAAGPQAGAAAARASATARTDRATAGGDPTHPKGVGDFYAAELGEGRAQCQLLRDLCGNPFRPVMIDPSWRTADVLGLAGGIYADGAFDRLPILADALQDAGCNSGPLLDHCRGPGPHVRGCWVVDLVLGKE
jgi:hypothetical protein